MWGSVAEWATVLVTVPTLFYAVVQLRLTRRDLDATKTASIAETRPYVWARFAARERRGAQDGVSLQIENGGRTPAYDVIVDFDENSAPWRASSVRSHFLFLPQKHGIRLLAPGDSRNFFVGEWAKGSELYVVWRDWGESSATVSYRSQDGHQYRERFSLSLRDTNGTGDLREPKTTNARTVEKSS